MTDLSLFVKSIGVGLAVAAPVGPMSLLCMRRTLTQGWRPGLVTGLGIAIGDGAFAGVAALGLAGLSAFMLAHQRPLHLVAGLLLLWLGLAALWRKPKDEATTAPQTGSLLSVLSGSVLLTLTNPPTIVMFAAVFAALAPRDGLDPGDAALTVVGVFAGSLAWWCVLVGAVSLARHTISPAARRWIDRISGAVLALFGVAELRRAI
jgi:threonine/homoserine/homoserine lactone efflux protein